MPSARTLLLQQIWVFGYPCFNHLSMTRVVSKASTENGAHIRVDRHEYDAGFVLNFQRLCQILAVRNVAAVSPFVYGLVPFCHAGLPNGVIIGDSCLCRWATSCPRLHQPSLQNSCSPVFFLSMFHGWTRLLMFYTIKKTLERKFLRL